MSGSNKILENHFHFKFDTEHLYVFFIGINNIKKTFYSKEFISYRNEKKNQIK